MLNRFLAELIDDAGLFPPARLPLGEALRAHDRANGGPFQWIVGRFIAPAGRLQELERYLGGVRTRPLVLSVILAGADTQACRVGVAQARDLVARCGGAVEVELFETPHAGALHELLDTVVDAFGARVPLYVELPPGEPDAGLHALAAERASGRAACAKLRCGGPRSELFPTPAAVAHFIAAAAALGVPFKATAGLHHPVRRLDPHSGCVMHGFLNVGAAAVFAHAGLVGEDTLREIVADEDPGSFALTPALLGWRELRAGRQAVAAARAEFFHAYGSCSTSEPLDDLVALGLLP
ncbi:hypothetical protein EPN52_09310 [bacterium]|nr:MAG: hypothetical protein EPN52_09310 [bacterium]